MKIESKLLAKRITAAALAFALMFSQSGVSVYAADAAGSEPAAQSESQNTGAQPTAVPETTAAPETEPEGTAAPETTAAPESTAAPEATPTVQPTAAPSATPAATATAAPSATPTAEPEENSEPMALFAAAAETVKLTDLLADGSDKLSVKLTDKTGNELSTIKDASGNDCYQITPGNPFYVAVAYELGNTKMTNANVDENTKITYTLPGGLNFANVANGELIDASQDNTAVGSFTVKGNVLTLQYTADFLNRLDNISGAVRLNCQAGNDVTNSDGGTTIQFEGVNVPIHVITPDKNVSGSKTAALSADGTTAAFTIKLTTGGDNMTVNLTDVLGSDYTYKAGTFAVDGTAVSPDVTFGAIGAAALPGDIGSHDAAGTVLNTALTFATAGEHTVTYTADVTGYSNSNYNNNNHAYWGWTSNGNPHKGEADSWLNFSHTDIRKDGGVKDSTKGLLWWDIYLNEGYPRADMGNAAVTDTLTSSANGGQTYTGALIVYRLNDATNQYEQYAKVDDISGKTSGDVLYTLPADAGKYTYKISYQTQAAPKTDTDTTKYTYTNTASSGGHESHKDVSWGKPAGAGTTDTSGVTKSPADWNNGYADGTMKWTAALKLALPNPATTVSDVVYYDDLDQKDFINSNEASGFATSEFIQTGDKALAVTMTVDKVTTTLTAGTDYTVEYLDHPENIYGGNKSVGYKRMVVTFAHELPNNSTLNFTYWTQTDVSALSGSDSVTVWNHANASYTRDGSTVNLSHKDTHTTFKNHLTKSAGTPKFDDALGAYVVDWTINGVNRQYSAQGSVMVTVTDTLPDGMSYLAGSAKVKGTAQEPTVSEDGKTLSWTFAQAQYSSWDSYTVTYQTKVDTKYNGATSDTAFTNNATESIDGKTTGHATATTTLTQKVLEKSGQMDQAGKYVDYTIQVNKGRLDLSAAGDVLKLEDTLPSNASLRQSTIAVTVHAADGSTTPLDMAKYPVSLQNGVLTFSVPDATWCTVAYSMQALDAAGAEKTDLTNTAKLIGDTTITTTQKGNYSVYTSSGTSSGSNDSISLRKQDANLAAQTYLADAEFALYEIDVGSIVADGKTFDGTPDPKYISQVKTGTTGADGKLAFTGLMHDTLYYYVETAAPAGYVLDSAPVYCVLPGGNSYATLKAEIDRVLPGLTVDYTTGSSVHTVTDVKIVGAEIAGTKIMTGRTMAADEFSFTLTPDAANADYATNNKAQTVKNAADGSFAFAAIPYAAAGTYNYTIAEVVPSEATEENHYTVNGVTYDTSTYTVTVNVTKDPATGVLSTDIVYPAAGLIFNNSYAAAGSLALAAQKTLNGAALTDGEFSFTLTPDAANADYAANNKAQTKQNDADGKVAFDAISYTVAGTYNYTIAEVVPSEATEENHYTVNGITYDTSTTKVAVTVSDADHNGTLTAVAKYGDDASATEALFTNNYAAAGSLALAAQKTLNGAALTDGEFSFTLTPDAANADYAANNKAQTKQNDASGKVAFDAISYTAAGTYNYTIAEVVPSEATEENHYTVNGITYDTSTTKVAVTVSDADHNGTLTAVAKYGDDASATEALFTNTMAGVQQALTGIKTLSGAALTDGEFSFTLTPDAANPDYAANNKPQTKQNDADGKVAFDAISYTAAGTYNYTVAEVVPALGDGETSETDETTGAVTITNAAKGTAITYDTAVYTYTVTVAQAQNAPGLTASTALQKAASAGAQPGDAPALTFANTLVDLSGAKTELKAEKIFYGASELASHDFRFTLTSAKLTGTDPATAEAWTDNAAADGDTLADETLSASPKPIAPQNIGLAATGSADGAQTGEAVFKTITYTKAGTYEYLIAEVPGSDANVSYDPSVYLATVVVTSENNKLTAGAPTYTWIYNDGEAVYTNAADAPEFYNNELMLLSMQRNVVSITGSKTLTDSNGNSLPMEAGAFRFDLCDSTGSVIATASNAADGSFALQYSYSKVGTSALTVKEQNGGSTIDGIVYDDTEYPVTVTVTENGGALSAVVSGTPAFTNTGAAEITVNKVWKDEGHEALRPESVSVNLYKNGDTENAVATLALSEANSWAGSFANLPVRDGSGNKIVYSVGEAKVPDGYTATVAQSGENSYTITNTYDEARNVFVTPAVKKVLEGREGIALTANEFGFTLTPVSAQDAAGSALALGSTATAYNDADGNVIFPAIAYQTAGVYTYEITENAGADAHITYDDRTVTLTVTVTDTDGALSASTAYAGGEGDSGDTFHNVYRPVVIRVQKTSKDGGEGLQGAVYGLYLVNEQGGADALVGQATADADGYMTYTCAIAGAKYYFKEISAPNGHTVDEYPSSPFRVVEENGTYRLAYEGDAGFDGVPEAQMQTFAAAAGAGVVSAQPIVLNAKGVSDEVTKLSIAKLDAKTHEALSGAVLQILEKSSGTVLAQWTSGSAMQAINKKLNVDTHYILHEVSAPDGYALAADTEFVMDDYGNLTVVSGTDAEWLGDTRLNLYDTKLDGTIVNTVNKEIVNKVTRQVKQAARIVHAAPQTGDDAPVSLVVLMMLAGVLGIVYIEQRKRGKQ
jgi:pilin isopeptide linkage protein